jgi:hypothetical protein
LTASISLNPGCALDCNPSPGRSEDGGCGSCCWWCGAAMDAADLDGLGVEAGGTRKGRSGSGSESSIA